MYIPMQNKSKQKNKRMGKKKEMKMYINKLGSAYLDQSLMKESKREVEAFLCI